MTLADPVKSPTPTSSVSSSSTDVVTPPDEPIRTPSPISNPTSPRRLLPPPSTLSLPAPNALLALTYPGVSSCYPIVVSFISFYPFKRQFIHIILIQPLGISEIEQWDSFKIMMEQSSDSALQYDESPINDVLYYNNYIRFEGYQTFALNNRPYPSMIRMTMYTHQVCSGKLYHLTLSHQRKVVDIEVIEESGFITFSTYCQPPFNSYKNMKVLAQWMSK